MVLIIALLVSGTAFVKVDLVHATTTGGAITTNTEWTVNDSPVTLSSSLIVLPNSTLTIDPGVTVNLGGYSAVDIEGTLIATGSPDNRIIFNGPDTSNTLGHISFASFNASGVSPSIIQYATLNKVSVQTMGSVTIDNCNFNFAVPQSPITISSGSPTISNNQIVFTGQDPSHITYGINVMGGTPGITGNEFDGNGQLTGINAQSNSGSFTTSGANTFSISGGNTFSNCYIGVKAGAAITIEGNTFEHCNDGIENNAGSITIRTNLIDGCLRYGIDGGGIIDSNTITNNQIGIHNPGTGSYISDNNIVGNTVNSVTAATASVDALDNWWGIADEATIKSTIYDATQDPSLGTISFTPYLSSPSPSAPSIPASTPNITPVPSITLPPTPRPTPTPVPTIPPTPTPTQKSETLLNQTSDLLNLNAITTITTAVLALVWVVVILGYVAKSGISRHKANKKKSE